MTPEPPPTSDGSSLPPHNRPPLENFAKDTTEMDLWDIESDFELPGEDGKPANSETKSTFNRVIPAPRIVESRQSRKTPDRPAFKTVSAEDGDRMGVSKGITKNRPVESTARKSASARKLDDDLEHWEDADFAPKSDAIPAVKTPETIRPASPQFERIPQKAATAESAPETTVQAPEQVETDDEFSPVQSKNAVPVSLRPHLGLSNFERIGLVGLLVILMGGAAIVFFSFLRPLAEQSVKLESADFPIKGSKVTIVSAKSYWRAPITEGAEAAAFRRGTVLLPVLELAVTGGPADIRVFFRDEAGQIVGDAITHNIHGDAALKIAATAGFDDAGMHAAYRTGDSKPWTIEVRETVTGEVSDRDSTKLFEMNISTDRY